MTTKPIGQLLSGASQTGASFTFRLHLGSPPGTTVVASSGSLTPAACTVKKN